MVERILTQEEIDELLSAFDSGQVDDTPPAAVSGRETPHTPGKRITAIDLTRGQNYSKWRIANLDVIFNAFARYYAISFTNTLQQGVTVRKGEIVSRFFDDFLSNSSDAGLLGGFTMEPLKGNGVFVFDKNLCFGLVQLMLGGGTSGDLVVFDREITAIESNIIRSLMVEGCTVFNRAFSSLDRIASRILKVETNPKLLNVLNPETEVIQVGFSVQVGELEGGFMMIIPYFSLEPFKDRLRGESVSFSENVTESNWQASLEKELLDMEITVNAVWGELQLTIQEILSLEKGDIIGFDYDEQAPVCVTAGDKPKFRAQPGLQNGKKAVRLVKFNAQENRNG